MRLYKNYGTGGQVSLALPNDLLWSDEFSWSPVEQKKQYSVTGALIIESATKQAGRPITLEPPAEMAWVLRAALDTLREWAALPNEVYQLEFQYPTDTRTFKVVFDHEAGALESAPVKGFPQHSSDDFFVVTLRLLEVQ